MIWIDYLAESKYHVSISETYFTCLRAQIYLCSGKSSIQKSPKAPPPLRTKLVSWAVLLSLSSQELQLVILTCCRIFWGTCLLSSPLYLDCLSWWADAVLSYYLTWIWLDNNHCCKNDWKEHRKLALSSENLIRSVQSNWLVLHVYFIISSFFNGKTC